MVGINIADIPESERMAPAGLVACDVGVLALQGAFREHIVRARGARRRGGRGPPARAARRMRRPDHPRRGVDGDREADGELRLLRADRSRHAEGMAVWGTCAGAILMAKRSSKASRASAVSGSWTSTVRRNAYGRQTESFEADLRLRALLASRIRGVFIRAPLDRERRGAASRCLPSTRGNRCRAAGRPAGHDVPPGADRRPAHPSLLRRRRSWRASDAGFRHG